MAKERTVQKTKEKDTTPKKFQYKTKLEGHGNWVTCLASTSNADKEILVTGSRDKTIMVWDVNDQKPLKSLKGHSHFVSDLCLSHDGRYALSSSWDHTLRLWDLNNGVSTNRFVGHTKDVLSVSLSADNRQIVSGSRDKTIKLWNTLGKDMATLEENGHSDWVSTVRFNPQASSPICVSGGWDQLLKVWELHSCSLQYSCHGHKSPVNTVAISPDGSLCASGGRDGVAMLWDLQSGTFLQSLPTRNTEITCLTFSPTEYILIAGTTKDIIIFDLKEKNVYTRLALGDPLNDKAKRSISCQSIGFSQNGNYLYAGCSDNNIYVWDCIPEAN